MKPSDLVFPSTTAAQAVPQLGIKAEPVSTVTAEGDLAHAESSLAESSLVIPRHVYAVTNEEKVDFNRFFERPIVILDFAWTPAFAGSATSLYNSYLGNAAIIRKLTGYSRMRFTMNLRFEWHPTAFHFGELVCGIVHDFGYSAAYKPLGDVYTIMKGPHVVLSAANPRVIDMQVPFIQTRPYLDITETDTLTIANNMSGGPGLYINDLAPLGFSNAAAVPSVQVTIRMWLTDVELVGPTGYLPFSQSAKGKGPADLELRNEGPVSSGLRTFGSALRGAASAAPVLAPWLKPVEIFANLGSSVAAMLGFSVPPDTRAPMPVVSRGTSSYALTDVPSSSQQVTFSSEAGTTVSPANLGVGTTDEMTLATWTQSESPLYLFTWALADATATTIFRVPVTPRFSRYDGANWFDTTNLCYASLPFRKWRGSIIYRFRVICSAQHRGRLRFVYEPVGTTLGAEPSGLRNNCVFDLSHDREFDVCVSWSAASSWLSTGATSTLTTTGMPAAMSATGTTYNIATDNGCLFAIVEAPLTAPQATNNDVQVYVGIRGGPDYMVADPDLYYPQFWTVAVNQSARSSAPRDFTAETPMARPSLGATSPSMCYINGPPVRADNLTLTTYGESPVSVRSLVKRFCYYNMFNNATFDAPTSVSNPWAWFKTVMYPAFSFQISVFGAFYSVGKHPLVTWLSWYRSGYIGIRGGARWRFFPVVGNGTDVTGVASTTSLPPPRVLVSRSMTAPDGQVINAAGFGSQWVNGNAFVGASFGGGGVVVNHLSDGTADVEVPYDGQYSFMPARTIQVQDITLDTSGGVQPIGVFISGCGSNSTGTQLFAYSAAADDTILFGFTGAPGMRVRTQAI